MILKPTLRASFMPLSVTFMSTISNDGIRNIAPWSCVMPVLQPLDLICVASSKKRDTLANLRNTGQFVLNLPGTDLVDKVIPTGRFSSPEVDEFELAGLEEKPSVLVKAPGIAGCYAWMECELHKEYEEEEYVLIVGKVVRLEVSDDVLGPDGSIDIAKAKPLMLTASKKGYNFSTLFSIDRFEPFSAIYPSSPS